MKRPLLSKGDDQLSVVSFNMLLKGFAGKHYYTIVAKELRAWLHRRRQLLELLEAMGADLYCMQEVECSSFAEEKPFLEQIGYAAVAPKDDSIVLACFEHL